MTPLRALHVRMEGMTAFYRHPLIVTGTQISTPMPAYSNLLGMLSACAGRGVRPEDTRIGFEFRCRSSGLDIERTVRWQMEKRGRLRPHSEGQGVAYRQVYWWPRLDLYMSNLELRRAFEQPAATPCFGRSQDIAWIRWVREVDLRPVRRGYLGPALVPYPQEGLAGWVLRLPEWFDNSQPGRPRRPGPLGHYLAVPSTTAGGLRFEVERDDLFHPSDADRESDAIYLHRWLEPTE